MSSLSTLPKGDSAWLLRKAIERIMEQVSVLETNIGSSTTGNSANTEIIFNDAGTLRGDAGLVYNKTTDALTVAGLVTAGSATITGALTANGNIAMANATAITSGGAVVLYVDTNLVAIRARATNGIRFQESTGANNLLTVSDAGVFGFLDGAGGTRMTLNSTGLGIGASPSALLHVQKSQNNETTVILNNTNTGTSASVRLDLQSNVNNYITLQSYGQNYVGTPFGIAGAKLNVISENAATAFSSGLLIGTTSTNPLYFATANVVRMTLDASGNLLVGTTSASGRVAVDTDLATYNGMAVKNTGTTYGASSFFFRFINSSGVTAGSIQHTAVTTTNYSTTSDSRLKESKGISTDTSVIDNTIVRDFVWKADGSTDRGVFAQEAQAVKPRAISAGSDDLTEDGNIKTPWSVDYSKYVPDLIVYCQQLKKQVVELTARVQTLETR